ncbi:hypothetical protein [Afipia clevelandensis]|uniref:Uncharacterized protein n=1 Tax=Afipia clevelandensis ATCC 49720 TaxID=883079 RepID=K8PDG4_9BRAD|nr:hypothetical protein [Afipia clevelandensis]EKS38749.1 hypothetical protein HMPREF9696_01218 [Afipia clevelandensis ATCC 49720]
MVQFLKITPENKDQAIPPYLRKLQEVEEPKQAKARKAKAPAKKAKSK